MRGGITVYLAGQATEPRLLARVAVTAHTCQAIAHLGVRRASMGCPPVGVASEGEMWARGMGGYVRGGRGRARCVTGVVFGVRTRVFSAHGHSMCCGHPLVDVPTVAHIGLLTLFRPNVVFCPPIDTPGLRDFL